MLEYAPTAVRSDDTMRVLSTQIGFVRTWVRAPARADERKKSCVESTSFVRLRESAPEPCEVASGPAFQYAMARSTRFLKKKNADQLEALPMRLGVSPR